MGKAITFENGERVFASCGTIKTVQSGIPRTSTACADRRFVAGEVGEAITVENGERVIASCGTIKTGHGSGLFGSVFDETM